LPPDACPSRSTEERDKFRQVTFVFRFSNKSSDWMDLAGLPAPALNVYVRNLAARHANARRALSEALEVDL
jgi:hypothetical protein